MVVHLAAPVSAIWGGEGSASGTMIIGRELYQSGFGEKALIATALLHLSASASKRLLMMKRSHWKWPPFSSFSWHSIAGFILTPLLAIHSYKHRWYPSQLGISPAFIDYGYVVHGLHVQPAMSVLGYGSILLAGAYHWIAGLRKITSGGPFNSTSSSMLQCLHARSRAGKKRALLHELAFQGAFAAVLASVGLGMARLALEQNNHPSVLLAKWDAIL